MTANLLETGQALLCSLISRPVFLLMLPLRPPGPLEISDTHGGRHRHRVCVSAPY